MPVPFEAVVISVRTGPVAVSQVRRTVSRAANPRAVTVMTVPGVPLIGARARLGATV